MEKERGKRGREKETVIKGIKYINRESERETERQRERDRERERGGERDWMCHVIGGRKRKCLVGFILGFISIFFLSVYIRDAN